MRDFQIEKVNYDYGQVAKGFVDVYESVFDQVKSQLQGGGGTELTVAGHSMGSALATLAAEWAASPSPAGGGFSVVRNYNQASPRVGNANFADYYDTQLPITTWRLVNTCDIVPKKKAAVSRTAALARGTPDITN